MGTQEKIKRKKTSISYFEVFGGFLKTIYGSKIDFSRNLLLVNRADAK